MADFTYYKSEKEIRKKIPEGLLPYLKYWRACKTIDPIGVPSNTHISPAIFKNHLPWIMLMKMDESGIATLKVHGTSLAHIYGDQTGRTMEESTIEAPTKENLSNILTTARNNITPVYQEGLNLVRKNTLISNIRLLSLAFSKNESFIDHILLICEAEFPSSREKPLY